MSVTYLFFVLNVKGKIRGEGKNGKSFAFFNVHDDDNGRECIIGVSNKGIPLGNDIFFNFTTFSPLVSLRSLL